MDAIILAVAHKEFSAMSRERFDKMYGDGTRLLLDIKGIKDRPEFEAAGYRYWRL